MLLHTFHNISWHNGHSLHFTFRNIILCTTPGSRSQSTDPPHCKEANKVSPASSSTPLTKNKHNTFLCGSDFSTVAVFLGKHFPNTLLVENWMSILTKEFEIWGSSVRTKASIKPFLQLKWFEGFNPLYILYVMWNLTLNTFENF